jgi:3-oxochol-4-en-24-oyl-CoA dehydrogenase
LPIAITDEQLALQSSIREWAKRAGTLGLVRDQEPGAGRTRDDGAVAQHWASLADLGVFAIGLPGAGAIPDAGGSAADLAAALAQLTDSLAPGPIMPTLLGGRLLACCADTAVARECLPLLAAGEISVAVALDPAGLTARALPDGSLLVRGTAGPVLGAGTSSHLLLGARADDGDTEGDNDVWFLVPAGHPGITVTERTPADFSRSLADIGADAAPVAPGQILTGVTSRAVRDLAAVLFAVEAAAVAGWCSRTAAEYAAIRHQFGRAIGAFQAIKHLCATMFCRAETASVLAWDAARAIDDDQSGLTLAAAAAAAHAIDAAVANAKDCIQVLGGIGFTWEHDAHLYLRRALSLRQLIGGTGALRAEAARLAAAGRRRRLPLAAAAGDELAEVRRAAREVAAALRELPAGELRQAIADSGYAAPAWPAPYGLGASAAACLIIDDELAAAGLTRPDLGIGGWAIPAILRHGSQAQRDRFAAATLRGEITWCQLFSEPEAGSDLASLRTRAERAPADADTGGGWLLTGQKVWTSLARQADWAICLARTDPETPEQAASKAVASKHGGITYFLVRMDSPGIDIRPLREITGREMFNQIFLDQVFVPGDCVVGQPGDGWRVTRTTLASERVAMGTGSSVGEAVEGLLGLVGSASDPAVLDRIGGLVAEGMAVSLLSLQAVIAQLRGADPGPLAAVRKLVGVRHRQDVAEIALELSGPAGAAADRDAAALVNEFLLTRCLSIAGGTTQILLSLVAERLLGLPREEAR